MSVRYFHDARDLEGALRCAQSSRDERLIARTHEWRGEPLERKADVERLLRKYPLLRG